MNDRYFSTRYAFDKGRTMVWKAIVEYLAPEIPRSGVIVELGAGYCDFINHVSAAAKYALDINPDVKSFCASDVTFIRTEVDKMKFKKESVDLFFASNLFEHLDDRKLEAAFARIGVALKPGGKIIIMQPNYYYSSREYWDDFTHVKAFSHVSLADFLVTKGFAIRRVEKRFLPFSFKSRLPKSYMLTRLYLRSFWRPSAKQMLVIGEKQRDV